MNMFDVCLYHSSDLDGICSGALVYHLLGCPEMVPFNYHRQVDTRDYYGKRIVLVDCHLPVQQLLDLGKNCPKVVWIDHHKTAIEAWDREDRSGSGVETVLEIGLAGCELTWKYLRERVPRGDVKWDGPLPEMPLAVKLLGRYDVWDIQEGVKEFQYGMRDRQYFPQDPEWVDIILSGDESWAKEIISSGTKILSYVKNTYRRVSRSHGFASELAGYPCIVMNHPQANSTMFEGAYDEARHKLMAAFSLTKDRTYIVSLFTTHDDVDVGKIAASFGGGGHQKAAGFYCKDIDFSKGSIVITTAR